MKRQEFLEELAKQLHSLGKEDIDNALEYYNEFLNDADILKEDDEVVGFDSPSAIAKKIIEEMDSAPTSKDEVASPSTSADGASANTSLSDFTRIDVSVITCDITLVKSDKNAVEYEFGKWERLVCCKVDEATKTLVIKTKRPPFMVGLGSLVHRGFVTIYYTNESGFESVSLETVSGSINVGALNLKQLSCETVSGSLFAEGVNAGRISCETISGSIRLGNIGNTYESAMKAHTISGRIEVDRFKIGEAKLDTISGAVILNNASLKRLNVQTTSGSVTAEGAFEGKTEISTVSGGVSVKTALPFNQYDYSISSVSGRTTVNQNRFKGSMITGKNNLIKANTVSGKITVDFADIL